MKPVILILLVTLAGCAPDPATHAYSGTSDEERAALAKARSETEEDRANRLGLHWRYTASEDDMTSGLVRLATINSLNEVTFEFPYQEPQRAQLQLRTHPRWGKNVILSVDHGQFLCHFDGCSVSIRYDGGRAWEYPASEPADHSSKALFINDYQDIVQSLKKASKVRIEARFYQEGLRVFEFEVQPLEWPRTAEKQATKDQPE
jgi:hypothetical protein